MTTSAAGLMTADELLRLGGDAHGELIAGEFREIPLAGGEHGEVAANLASRSVVRQVTAARHDVRRRNRLPAGT